MRKSALILILILLAGCQSTTQTSDVLSLDDGESSSTPIVAESIGSAPTTVGFVLSSLKGANGLAIRNGAVLAQEQLSGDKLSLAIVNSSSIIWPDGKSITLVATSGSASTAAPEGSIPVALDSIRPPSGGFAFVASHYDSLEAGLRHAAAKGGRIVIATNEDDIESLSRVKANLGGLVDIVTYGSQESAAQTAAKLSSGDPVVAIGFSGKDRKIVDIAGALRRSNQQVVIVGHKGWTETLIANSALEGAIIARPDTANFGLIAERYQARFNQPLTNAAIAGFDVMAIAAGIMRTSGEKALSREALLAPSGFRGASGAFRFRQDGTFERLFEIAQVKSGALVRIAPAPSGF